MAEASPGTAGQAVCKFPTDIPGFEFISDGGLPSGRATLVAGSSGSGKTVFCAQFLAEGIRRREEPGVFVTCEEPPAAIRANLAALDWPVAEWEESGQWAFVDLAPGMDEESVTGSFDLGALLPRLRHAVDRVGARRLVVDSLGSLFSQFSDQQMVRRALGRLMAAVRDMGITTLVTAERTEEYGPIARFQVEEFVADSVVLLRNGLEGEKRRRTLEVLKMRGTSHRTGEYPFTIGAEAGGLSVVPLSAIELNRPASGARTSFGDTELDRMCDGGLLEGSITLVAGPTGTGKTLISTHFLNGAPEESALLLAFEEGADQLRRNARGWGMPLEDLEAGGRLRISAAYPETASLEDHLIRIKHLLEARRPRRVVVDSLSALERISSQRSFREFVIALVAFLREQGITALFTTNTNNIQGGSSVSEDQVSSMTDTIVLLRYLEQEGAIHRGLAVLKMRGSNQDKAVRTFTVTERGLRIGGPVQGSGTSLLGLPTFD
ncbi:circadian clock protein KaiC [Thiohalorhabdus methylotrophus]|uniref:non-specific serine/threonine protein kinase n=1 Tax=Thiohalorhabdus methylotrophus TaxID=3242694 RepID=A0ABV4TUV8_9GAMM